MDREHEELMYEWNARYDYLSELAAEHRDFEAEREMDDEPPCLAASGWWSARVCACRAEKFRQPVGSPDYGPVPF